ncbi:MAG TPA: VOC family protein [Ramlibacter sp.]|nr:VOC family protein [Ramlibacter sp.]
MIPDDPTLLPPPESRSSVVKPYMLSHGTCECISLKDTREFYEGFLGLDCVRHSESGMLFRLGTKFHVVCIEVGDQVRPCTLMNHWGLDVGSKEEVEEAHRKAVELKDRYKMRQVLPPKMQHGVYSFYMEDLNQNWWEIQYYDGLLHDDFWALGDRVAMDHSPLTSLHSE